MNCVHLDFHTGPWIEGIGERFDKTKFQRTLTDAKVDLITVFAKCHHGYSYFPTEVGTMHPNLKFDLLGAELEACREIGIKAPVYITLGWSKKDADEHPEWHQINFQDGKPIGSHNFSGDMDAPLPHCAWITLCPGGSYLDYLETVTREVCSKYDVRDGVFYDICFIKDACACESCKAGMIKEGLNPDSYADARIYYKKKRIEMMKRLTSVVHEYSEGAPVFYNGGADMNRTEYHPYQTHYELEDLPTAWGGYDLMPLRAKFFERYGRVFWGMTGKFHHNWGEFGGFKNKEALRYECADMLSVGASTSVGDHLHPSGDIDESSYALIGHAFNYCKRIEKYCFGTKAHTDLAIWLSHCEKSDVGCSKLLQVMQLEYDVIERADELQGYKAVILPDAVRLTADDERALLAFVNAGGRVIASYESAPATLGVRVLGRSPYDVDYIRCDIDGYSTPFLSYSTAMQTECEGEILAQVYEPYFNRTARHFCGHKNTPNRTEPAEYPALVKRGGFIYFAHPVFKAYNESGSYVLEQYIMKGISAVYERGLTVSGLPSCGRVRLRENAKEKFLALHLLYAPPVNRGNVCLLCDFPTLHGVSAELKTDLPVKAVYLANSGERVEFSHKNGTLTFTLPPFSVHELAIIDFS